jgi:hypothetical protein
MVAWRLASLPNRYWSRRPDEALAAAQIGGPSPWGLGPAPGMYPDPWYPGSFRFWDGSGWAGVPQPVASAGSAAPAAPAPPQVPPPPPGY